MGFLEDLKNSPFGKKLTEVELKERGEIYRVFFKPLLDKLELIEKNTNPQKIIGGSGPDVVFIPANVILNNYRLPITRPFIKFLGLSSIGSALNFADPTTGDPNTALQVNFGTDPSLRITLKPGESLSVPRQGDRFIEVYLNSGYTHVTNRWTFLQMESLNDFVLSDIPFAQSSTGLIKRATVNGVGDLFTVFRTAPTVNIGTFPANQKVIITDGTDDLAIIAPGAALVQVNGGTIDIGSSLPAGTNTIGNVKDAGSSKTILRTSVSFSGTGNNTLVAAAGASTKIKVLGLFLFASAATNIIIQSGAGGTAIIGQMNLAANQGFVLPVAELDKHWCQTADNTLLNCNQSGTAQIGGVVVHVNEA